MVIFLEHQTISNIDVFQLQKVDIFKAPTNTHFQNCEGLLPQYILGREKQGEFKGRT